MENSLRSHFDEVMSTFDEEEPNPKTYQNQFNDASMLQRMYKCYEEDKFCDFALVVGNNQIKTHKLVLNSCSEYFESFFNRNWQDSDQDHIEIDNFDESTLRCMLNYVYTGKLELNSRNVLKVLAACDFFQLYELDFIKESITDYVRERVSEENCASILVVAQLFHAVKLKDLLIKYVARNFFRVVKSEDLVKLPVDLLVNILQSRMLVVDYGRDFLPLVGEQEDFILDFLLKYISYQAENEQQSDELLSKLVYCIHFHCLCPSSLDKLWEYAASANCDEGLKLIMEAKEEIKCKDDPGLIKLWGTEREASSSIEKYYRVHAREVDVGPEQDTFGDGTYINEPLLFIKGMKIWIRLWDNHPVLGGLKVFYSNGDSPMYGSDDEDSTVHEFHLGEDERIVKAEVRSGWMIDGLKFFTNKGRELGPYGGRGGREYSEKPRGEYGFLSYVSGTVVRAQGELGITKLRLMWREFPYILHPFETDENAEGEDDNSSQAGSSSSSESEMESE